MNIKKSILLCIALGWITITAYTQTPTEYVQKNFGLGIVPQYAFSHGTRIDLDFRINDKNHWLVVSPLVFISSEPNYDWNYNSMAGSGIELQHKIFLKEELSKRNFYFAYGPMFNWFSVKDNGLTIRHFAEKGGEYIELTEEEITTNVFKAGGNLLFGLQYLFSESFYMDMYLGTGIRFSFDDQTTGLHDYYNEWWGDMGYSGTLIVGGFRFGVLF